MLSMMIIGIRIESFSYLRFLVLQYIRELSHKKKKTSKKHLNFHGSIILHRWKDKELLTDTALSLSQKPYN